MYIHVHVYRASYLHTYITSCLTVSIFNRYICTQATYIRTYVHIYTYVHYVEYSPTTTSHTCYTTRVNHVSFSVERETITRIPLKSHGFAKPHMIPTQPGSSVCLSLVGV